MANINIRKLKDKENFLFTFEQGGGWLFGWLIGLAGFLKEITSCCIAISLTLDSLQPPLMKTFTQKGL